PPEAGASYSERVMTHPSLQSYWRLGESSGTTARDLKGGRDGTYAGGVTLGASGALPGDPDTAATFNGTNGTVTLPTLPPGVDFTVSGWQRIGSAPTSANNTLYGAFGTLRLMPRPAGFYAGVYVGGTEYVVQGVTTSNTNAWVHWALVRSGATMTIYRNGIQVGTRAGLPASTTVAPSGQIGRLATMYPTTGQIDDVAVFSSALSPAELAADVAAAPNAPTGDPPDPEPGPTDPMHVDRDSVGGSCSDERTAAQATSVTTPWCSLEHAVQSVPSGGTVLVRRGSYPNLAVDAFSRAETVTFRAFGGEQPVLDGMTVTSSGRLAFEGLRITDVTDLSAVSHFTLRGNDISPHDVRITSGSNLLFEDNDVHDLTMDLAPGGRCIPPRCGYGFRINTASDVTFRGNRFHRIPADAIQSGTATRYVIEDNTFDEISAFVDPEEHSDAIQFYAGSQDLVLRRNIFRDTRGPLLYDTISGAAQHNMTIENNVFVRQRDWALNIANAPALKLRNNTAWHANTGVTLRSVTGGSPTTGVVAVNNVLQAFSAQPAMFAVEDYNLIVSGLRTGPNDLSVAPHFVDPDAGDYRLAGGSPGIDAGTSDHGAPATDTDGAPRTDTPTIPNTGGGASPYYDMGAYEFTGTYAPPAGSYADAILATPGLLSYWRLGETSGTTASDAKGGRHGTYLNGVALGAEGALVGDANTAASFDGVNDSVTVPALPSSVDFTVEGWQNLTGATNNTTLYGKTGNMRIMPRPSGVYVGVWAGGERIIQAVTPSNVGVWVHWAVVRSGASLRVYRNGIEVGARTDLPATTAVDLTGDIGRVGTLYPAAARIDEVAVYDRALSVADVRDHIALAGR
ncbi:MAG: LamG-like jellyroll fold domain-containing protein, partial [Solirubrobacteraceae bacterium]|nr:LamG-like jellyroll fold domain-containing protein [Solirubrobacteraceae bacterium]